MTILYTEKSWVYTRIHYLSYIEKHRMLVLKTSDEAVLSSTTIHVWSKNKWSITIYQLKEWQWGRRTRKASIILYKWHRYVILMKTATNTTLITQMFANLNSWYSILAAGLTVIFFTLKSVIVIIIMIMISLNYY